jgi:phage recombination protein Bet
MADQETAIQTMPHVATLQRAQRPPLEFSPEQRKMIRDTFANGASDSEFQVLMEIAKVRNLNPLLRQIHFVNRWDSQKQCKVWSVQVAIDGLRAEAERTGLYDGQDEPVFEHDIDGNPTVCRVSVYRKDWSRPSVGVAHFEEYAQTKKDGGLTAFWATKKHIMLAKCAEALAIRKAFPEDTAGLYVPEEMGETPEDVPARKASPRAAQVVTDAPVVEVAPPKPTPPARPREEAPKAQPAASDTPHNVMQNRIRLLWDEAVKRLRKPTAEARWKKGAKGYAKDQSQWTDDHLARLASVLFPEEAAENGAPSEPPPPEREPGSDG